MMNRPVLAVAVVLSASVALSSAVVISEFAFVAPRAQADTALAKVPLFQFERQAQLHCPEDSIVWATASFGTYDSSADRWYGRTSSGAYGCRHEVETAGYRAQRVGR
jgi:hypothetical protein